ncbi:60S ribosomal protein L7 [Mycena sanguinolenta]|uniref:60S ribosomal protein L7 n=1 Tax=Mycena sanguinolenta TaxID=230812 RepID=A0A8H6YGD7_9AGAR|nr:60S ribosomal protein L7 [Mycena sanguinolenta]
MPHPPQRIARSLTRFGRPPPLTKPLKRNWRTRLPIPHTPIVGREAAPCRLEEHYHATLADNAMYMTYIHESGPRPPPRDIRLKYDPANPYSRFRRNPQVGGDKMGTKPPPPDSPANVTEKGAGKHGVSGVKLVHGKKSVGGWIRPGIPVGAKVELQGAPMYEFIAQLTEFVLPRLKDFGGVLLPPPGASGRSPSAVSGVVSMGLPPAAMQYFPQIEVNVDAYPKMYGMHIHFVTNATGTGAENRARALVSGLQARPPPPQKAPAGAASKKAAPKDSKAKAAKKAALQGAHGHSARKERFSVSFHRPKTLRLARAPKYPRKSIPHAPRMDQFRTIVSPLNTESAMKKIEEHNTLVFIVDIKSNKRQIKDAVKKLYDVQAAKVNTLIRPDGKKKAYVRLTADHDALDVANKIGFI